MTAEWLRQHALSPDELRSLGGLKWATVDDDVLAAWVADMDFRPPARVLEAVDRLGVGAHIYAPPAVADRARSAFTQRMLHAHGWSLDSEGIRIVTDLNQALTASVMAFSSERQGVAVVTPIYKPFTQAIEATNRVVVAVPLSLQPDGYRLDIGALEEVLRRCDVPLLLLCHPHNPTGHVFTQAELTTIAKLAKRYDVTVVSDEIHAELTYPGNPHIPFGMAAADLVEGTVTLQSPTKTFNTAGTRCAFIHLGSPDLARHFDRVFPYRILGQVSTWGMAAATAAWTECDDWLTGLKAVLNANRALVLEWASREPRVAIVDPQSTYFAWMRLHGDADAAGFFLDNARVSVSAGPEFGATGDWFRLNFATSSEILKTVLQTMSAALAGDRVMA